MALRSNWHEKSLGLIKSPACGRPEAVLKACLLPPDQFTVFPQNLRSFHKN